MKLMITAALAMFALTPGERRTGRYRPDHEPRTGRQARHDPEGCTGVKAPKK